MKWTTNVTFVYICHHETRGGRSPNKQMCCSDPLAVERHLSLKCHAHFAWMVKEELLAVALVKRPVDHPTGSH